MTAEQVRSLLPWRPPFVMVDRMIECAPHEKIVTIKQVGADEPMARGDTGEDVFFPAVLVVEGLSQSAALLFQLTYGPIDARRAPMLGHLRARFSTGARAGDTITYTVEAVKMTSAAGIFRGVAEVDGIQVVEAELAFAVVDVSP